MPVSDQPALPAELTLSALQDYVRRMVAARGFTTDRNEIFIMLVEEVGELATEYKHRAFYPERFDRENLAHELADILLYLVDLANGFGVELWPLWREHERENDRRFAERRGHTEPLTVPSEAEPTVNALVAHCEAKRRERAFADSAETLLILLCEEVGEIAHEVRKHWKGQAEAGRIGREMLDALHYLFRLAHVFEVELERAVTDKERRNAERTWRY